MGLGRPAPTASDRAKCWASRDAYFACLDKNGLWLDGLAPSSYQEAVAVDPFAYAPGQAAPAPTDKRLLVCSQARLFFESQCLASWVAHFNMLRVKELQTQKLVEKVQADEAERLGNASDFWERVKKRPS